MTGRSRRGPLVALLLAALLLFAAATAVVPALANLGRSAALVAHTYQVIVVADGLLSTLKDAETGQRGFLLTRHERYLEPYTVAVARLDVQRAELRRLVVDNPSQLERLSAIEALAAAKRAELERTVRLARAGDHAGALALVETEIGKDRMDELRQRLAGFTAEEQRLLSQRQEVLAAAQRRLIAGAALAGVAGVLAVAVASAMLLGQRRRIQEALSSAESALAARLAELRAIYDSAPVGLSYATRDMRFVTINQRLAAINGVPVDQHIGRTPSEAIPAVARSVEPIYARVIETGAPAMGVEIRTATGAADGQPRDYIASYWPVKDDAGTVQGINIAVLDITERKAAEAALARANAGLEREVAARTADLAAANAQLEAFAYSVSHDLRAPLRGMEGFGRILLDDFGGALGPRGARYAERIVAAAGRMETLINDLLTFSRLQRAEVSLRVLDPLPIFQRAAEEAMTGLEPGKADITLPANMPAVAAEPTVLAQAARNLLTNAVKFRRPGEPARVTVWAERLDGRVRIHVDDQGIGVAPEHRERIFGAFERLHGQESYPGTGIGLAIVRAAAERLGGQVGVADGPGGGARFFIELAAADAPGGTAGYRPMAATGEQGIA